MHQWKAVYPQTKEAIISKNIQSPATSGQITPAQHLHNLRELANQTEHALQYCELELSKAHVHRLMSNAVIMAGAARDILDGMKPGAEISPDPIPALADFSANELITLETSKIIALADVLIASNQAGSDLFELTAETLLCSIIDCAKAIDTAAVKINQEG